MGRKNQKRLITALFLLAAFTSLSAQNSSQTDSLVRLENAKSLELIQIQDKDYRKAVQATFLHNGTYLICDTALWNVNEKTINCQGHVQLIQDETILTSDKLDYLIDEDLAQFRGSVVQLANKKNNILRTRDLDYNTKDSLAVFRGGAAMKDEDGQVIESDEGTYSSMQKLFTFNGNVNMFSDSVFVKTNSLEYDSDKDMATFTDAVDFWKDDNMLSAGSGWYDHNKEIFFFRDKVHGLSKEQESWSDTLYFYRKQNDLLMLGSAHVQDTTRNVAALADYIFYKDTLSRVTMKHRAAVAMVTGEDEKKDTVYCGADTLVYHTMKRCDVPEAEVTLAEKRVSDMLEDAVDAYRKRAAQEDLERVQRQIEEAEASGEILPGMANRRTANTSKKAETPKPEPGKPAVDTLAAPPADSLLVQPPDTTKVGFLKGRGRVGIFKKDMQVRCDSLRYSDLDSIARFYIDPIIWNETKRQYTADSLFVLVKDKRVDRANLLSNAFITVQESDRFYDQIKGTDVVAFFDEDNALKRFDCLGGTTALFYLKEDEDIATVNVVECKMMSATLTDGEVDRVYYYDSPKNDAYPVVQLPDKDQTLRGFVWRPDDRPKSKEDITTLEVKPSERKFYESKPRAQYKHTSHYFPGYIDNIYKELEEARIRRNTPAPADTTAAPVDVPADVAAAADSLLVPPADTLAVPAPADTLAAVADSLVQEPPHVPTEKELRKEERELARQLRIAHRDAVWAEKDAKDAAKAAAKAQKALDRKRERTRKQYIRQCKQDAIDAAKLQKYIEKYQKQKARKDERKQQDESSGERAPRPEAGGEL